MQASQLTYGIEIECYIPNGYFSSNEVGRYHSGSQISGFPHGWTAQEDGSIRDRGPVGYVAVEIVSPVLSGEQGLTEIVAVVDWLNSVEAKVTAHCGLHVHVGAAHLSTSEIVTLINEFRCYERVLFALNGSKAQDRYTNRYCKNSAMWAGNPQTDRYQSLNLTNLMSSKKTVEFRLGAGTLDVEAILALVIAFTGLVAKVTISPRQHQPRPMNLGEFIRNVVSRFSMIDLGGDYSKFAELVSESGMF
jgi:hypothetical protein